MEIIDIGFAPGRRAPARAARRRGQQRTLPKQQSGSGISWPSPFCPLHVILRPTECLVSDILFIGRGHAKNITNPGRLCRNCIKSPPMPRSGLEIPTQHRALARQAGAGPDHRGGGRRSQRHRHLQPGRGAVRLQPFVDHGADLSADGGDPDDQRPDRARHRPRPGLQHGRGDAAHGWCWGCWRCCSSPTPSMSAPTWRRWAKRPSWSPASTSMPSRFFRVPVAGAAAFHSLSPLCAVFDGADLQPVRLCRHPVHAAAGLEQDRRRADRAASQSDASRRDNNRGDLRHHHQPLSVLLAERPGGRGSGPARRRASACWTRPAKRPRRCHASASTPFRACWCPT